MTININQALSLPARLVVTEPLSGLSASLDVYQLYAAIQQAHKKAEAADSEVVLWQAIREYVESQFSGPVKLAENQLLELIECTCAAVQQLGEERKKKVADLRYWLTSTLESTP